MHVLFNKIEQAKNTISKEKLSKKKLITHTSLSTLKQFPKTFFNNLKKMTTVAKIHILPLDYHHRTGYSPAIQLVSLSMLILNPGRRGCFDRLGPRMVMRNGGKVQDIGNLKENNVVDAGGV